MPEPLQLPNGVFRLIESAEETAGERVSFEITLPAGAGGPPPHFHPSQQESWSVIDGELTLTVDGRKQTLSSGQELTIPPRAVHTFANPRDVPVTFRDLHTPALDFQDYIETLGRLTAAGKLSAQATTSTLIYGAMVLCRHRPMQVSARARQRLAESALALLGRALRYRIE